MRTPLLSTFSGPTALCAMALWAPSGLGAHAAATGATGPLPKPSAGETYSATPPSTVLIPTRPRVWIGTELDAIEKLVEHDVAVAPNLIGEYPAHQVRVDEFHLMVTEVTNEQFREFVQATGHRPPPTWGEAALLAAQREYGESLGRAIKEAQDAGLPPPPRVAFNRDEWWEQNWPTVEWQVPANLLDRPVTWVNFADAVAYAHWAGMRLMTEQEFQSAGRADKKFTYPWGDEWNDAGAATAQGREANPIAVGSRPEGATREKVHDLVGNAWEWTSSRYQPFPGYKKVDFEIGPRGAKRKVTAEAAWDADLRVVVGGSVQNTALAARLTTRRPTDRSQRTNALGFRTAASPRPGVDWAQTQSFAPGLLGEERPAVQRAVGIDRWKVAAGTAKVEGYQVIRGYEFALVVPPERLPFISTSELTTATLTAGPQPLFVLATSMPMVRPALPAGAYLVSYRAAGKDRGREAAAVPAGEVKQTMQEQSGPDLNAMLDVSVANFVFSDLEGTPLAALPVGLGPRYERPDRALNNLGQVGVVLGDGAKGENDRLSFTAVVPGRTTSPTAWVVELPVEFAVGSLAGPWRR